MPKKISIRNLFLKLFYEKVKIDIGIFVWMLAYGIHSSLSCQMGKRCFGISSLHEKRLQLSKISLSKLGILMLMHGTPFLPDGKDLMKLLFMMMHFRSTFCGCIWLYWQKSYLGYHFWNHGYDNSSLRSVYSVYLASKGRNENIGLVVCNTEYLTKKNWVINYRWNEDVGRTAILDRFGRLMVVIHQKWIISIWNISNSIDESRSFVISRTFWKKRLSFHPDKCISTPIFIFSCVCNWAAIHDCRSYTVTSAVERW